MKVIRVLLAGAFGGLINSLTLWIFGALGISPALGFTMTPDLTPKWLIPRIVISGLWGLLFLLPVLQNNIFKKGLVLSIAPAIFMLFVVFPMKMKAGILGLNLGPTAPLFAVLFTMLWGLSAALWLRYIQKK